MYKCITRVRLISSFLLYLGEDLVERHVCNLLAKLKVRTLFCKKLSMAF